MIKFQITLKIIIINRLKLGVYFYINKLAKIYKELGRIDSFDKICPFSYSKPHQTCTNRTIPSFLYYIKRDQASNIIAKLFIAEVDKSIYYIHNGEVVPEKTLFVN